jgi:radical SAM superfamily enzyme YgiQ (UPF0313 family)
VFPGGLGADLTHFATMNILLVKPHPELLVARRLQQGFLHLEPLELETVAGGASPEDEIAILDLGLEENPRQAFLDRITSKPHDIIGFTGYSSNAGMVREYANLIKWRFPETLVIVGGIHATMAPHDYHCPQIDLVVRGEGGSALRQILARLRGGESPAFDGIALSPADPGFLEKAAQPPPEYPAWEAVPMPRRDLVERDRYFCVWTGCGEKKIETMFPRVAAMRTSVGCAFNCSFCVVPHLISRKYIERTPEDVVDEIASLKEGHIYFVDDEMFLNAKRVERVAELLIERGIRKHYTSWARADTIVRHPDLFQLWRRAGLDTVYVGIESMSDDGLADYNKRTSVKTNKEAIATIKKLGITLHASLIVNPDFTDADFDHLENEVRALCPAEVTFTVLSPSPGTAYWNSKKAEFICDPYRFYDCMHTILPTRLPLKRFYARFGKLTDIALRNNPLRRNRISVPWREVGRAIYRGTLYIFALHGIHRDY